MDRAVLFIDGNNWYHGCKACGVKDLFLLDYVEVSKKLTAPREWTGTRYYIGALKQAHNGYREQRQFLSRLQNSESRITVHLGRIEERPRINVLAQELRQYVAATALDPGVRDCLLDLAERHHLVSLLKEKAVDIQLAVDMFKLAVSDEYESAYLLSGDGDFTPAVQAVREKGKKVYCVSPTFSAALKNASNAFIPLKKEWFDDCFGMPPLT